MENTTQGKQGQGPRVLHRKERENLEEWSSVPALGHFISPRQFSRDQRFLSWREDRTGILTTTAAVLPKTIMKNKISSKMLSTCISAAALVHAISQE